MVRSLIRLIKIGIVVGLAGFILIQFIPYGHSHGDPPATHPVTWNSPQTEQLAMQACGDCHSNKTTWPWYSNVAPISWVVQEHVDHGRQILNFSNFSPEQRGADRAARSVRNGNMPPGYYTLIHSNARLSATEKQQLIDGLIATFGSRSDSATTGTSSEGN